MWSPRFILISHLHNEVMKVGCLQNWTDGLFLGLDIHFTTDVTKIVDGINTLSLHSDLKTENLRF